MVYMSYYDSTHSDYYIALPTYGYCIITTENIKTYGFLKLNNL